MQRHVVAILNPISGRRSATPRVEHVGRLLEARGCSLDIRTTSYAGHATELAGECASAADAILTVGGDGTINEVVNGLLGRQTPVVLWGMGTENMLARELGMPRAPEDVVETLLRGEPVPFDVGICNGRCFLAVAGIGFDAECVEKLSRIRQGHISHWDYLMPIWRTFWSHRFPDLRIKVDGTCVFSARGFVLVGNLPRYSVGLRPLRLAVCDDGLLDVCAFPCASRITLAQHAVRVVSGRHIGRGGVTYCRGKQIEVSSDAEVPVELDGEAAGLLPVRIDAAPRSVTFLCHPRRAAVANGKKS